VSAPRRTQRRASAQQRLSPEAVTGSDSIGAAPNGRSAQRSASQRRSNHGGLSYKF
jgi:hypothetical protein